MTISVHHPARNRNRLPNRRRSELFATEFRSGKFTITISRFCNGEPAEIFVDFAKPGSDAATDAHDVAVVLSVAMQYGVPITAMRHSISRVEGGKAASIVGVILDRLAEEQERAS